VISRDPVFALLRELSDLGLGLERLDDLAWSGCDPRWADNSCDRRDDLPDPRGTILRSLATPSFIRFENDGAWTPTSAQWERA
jgi:hypothetical protein